jgi:hypothetical protein
MDWLILILGVPAILIPLVLLFGFAGCATVVCTDDADCPVGTVCFQGACVVDAPPPLSAPENLAAIALDDHSVALTWTSDDPPGTVFQIERAEEDGQFEPIASTDLEDVSATGATDRSRGLQEGVTFIYRVGAASEQEDPVFSDDTSSATVFPAAPVNLRATPLDISSIKLSWDNASAVATDFILEHRLPGGTFNGGEIYRGTDTTFTHSGDPSLVEGSAHEYRVFAFVREDNGGVENDVPQDVKSPPSAIVSARTLAFTAVFTAPPGTLTVPSDASGFCVVQRLSQALLARGGTPHTQVRIVLRGPNTGSLTLDRVTISQVAATGNPYDPAADLTDVAGVNIPPNTPVTIQANTAVTIGPVNYALDPTQDLLVAFDIRSGNVLFGGLTGAFFFSNAATAEAGVQPRTPNYQNQTADTLSLIEIIQVL